MKTDRFTDIIRRKLESIRPEFTDKDWARMQATLKDANLSQPNTPDVTNPFSGGVWSGGKSWLLAAASVSTVVLIAFSIWQQREINQLRQAIGNRHPQSINQSVPAPANADSEKQAQSDVAHSNATPIQQSQGTTTSANRNESQTIRPDTVYITRYVPVPSRAKPEVRAEERLSRHTETPETPPEQRYAADNPTDSPATTRQPTNRTYNQQTESHDVSSTPSVTKNTNNESTIINKSINKSAKSPNKSANDKELSSQDAGERTVKQTTTAPANPVANQSNVAVNTRATVDNEAPQAETPVALNQTSATYEPVVSRPLSIGNKNWNAALAQRAKRMQPARAMPVMEQTKAPATQRVERVATRFRAGVGGELAPRFWSAGVVTEVLLGHHWTVGVGLSQTTYQNRFITEDDFNGRTQRDFRKEFARPGDYWRDILNIDTRQVRLQIPVSLGYRILLNQALTLVPTIGTYLNLSSSENVTYYCRDIPRFPMQPKPQNGLDEINTVKKQSVDLLNSLSLGAGLEWQRGHWVMQTIPMLTIPTDVNVNKIDLNWQRNTAFGLRARLLYQF